MEEKLLGLKVVYLKMNRAYAVIFGESLVPIGPEQKLLFRSYFDLLEALQNLGLLVDSEDYVYIP